MSLWRLLNYYFFKKVCPYPTNSEKLQCWCCCFRFFFCFFFFQKSIRTWKMASPQALTLIPIFERLVSPRYLSFVIHECFFLLSQLRGSEGTKEVRVEKRFEVDLQVDLRWSEVSQRGRPSLGAGGQMSRWITWWPLNDCRITRTMGDVRRSRIVPRIVPWSAYRK